MNYMPEQIVSEREFQNMKESMERFWEPEGGKHVIKLLSEMGTYTVNVKGKRIAKPGFAIQVISGTDAGKQKIFLLGTGTTYKSLLGQFIKLKAQHSEMEGKLIEVEVSVQFAGTDNEKNFYTIRLANGQAGKVIKKSGPVAEADIAHYM